VAFVGHTNPGHGMERFTRPDSFNIRKKNDKSLSVEEETVSHSAVVL
jgi:hypothetical protein